jgi:hypothetical protein
VTQEPTHPHWLVKKDEIYEWDRDYSRTVEVVHVAHSEEEASAYVTEKTRWMTRNRWSPDFFNLGSDTRVRYYVEKVAQ